MNTCVCVLSNSGERLMPTFRLGKVRRLLKDRKAKIVKHHPFTIQLLYDSKTNTQPIEICEDVGYNYIGISVKSESHEYVSAQYDTLQDEKEHHDDCRMHRRTRRNRLRYRKPRFDNRKRGEGWLAPSLKHNFTIISHLEKQPQTFKKLLFAKEYFKNVYALLNDTDKMFADIVISDCPGCTKLLKSLQNFAEEQSKNV